ncbi:MAG TPA: universal stress protein [Steroidobacteraceae bacterium]|nr:universal stress protein [Steroidobacteraceae bacterium]
MAGKPFRSILVCIEFPAAKRQPVLRRAVEVARRTGARLVLFHSAFSQLAVGPRFQDAVNRETARQRASEARALRDMAGQLRADGLRATVKSAWDYPPHEAIVREVLRSKPDLVVAGSRHHAPGARMFLANTDWQLIRQCPVPLLFVKRERQAGKARVLAAIDPMHRHARPSQLDRRILAAGAAMSAALGGRLDVVHAHVPLYAYMPEIYGDVFMMTANPELEQRYLGEAQRAVERLATEFEIPRRRLHVETGSPGSVLPEMARRLRSSLIVMGAVSRSGLRRLFIGSTAERTLDHLPCDLLVIKPRGFRTTVPRRPPAVPGAVPL